MLFGILYEASGREEAFYVYKCEKEPLTGKWEMLLF